MANAQTANKIYVDSTGELTTTRTKVAMIIFTPSASGDSITLRETSGGANCVTIKAEVNGTKVIDLSSVPMVFGNGIYVQALSAGAVATLVTTQRGGE